MFVWKGKHNVKFLGCSRIITFDIWETFLLRDTKIVKVFNKRITPVSLLLQPKLQRCTYIKLFFCIFAARCFACMSTLWRFAHFLDFIMYLCCMTNINVQEVLLVLLQNDSTMYFLFILIWVLFNISIITSQCTPSRIYSEVMAMLVLLELLFFF